MFLENLGLPVPGETMLITAAGLAEQGRLSLPLVFLIGAAAAILGDNCGFIIGRAGGRRVLTGWFPRLLSPERVARVDGFFQRYGAGAVFLARFISGVRVIAAIVAGSSTMAWRRFLIANGLGGIVWAAVVCAVGYYGAALGARLLPPLGTFHRWLWALLVTIALPALAIAWLRRRRPGAGRAPPRQAGT
ncbi:MAG: DedA family protein [Gemmatimonadota bacterium]